MDDGSYWSQGKQNVPQQQVEDVNNPQVNIPVGFSYGPHGGLWFLEILRAGGLLAAVREREAQKEASCRKAPDGCGRAGVSRRELGPGEGEAENLPW